MNIHLWRHQAVLLIAAGGVCALSACGGSSTSGAASTTRPAAPTTVVAASTTTDPNAADRATAVDINLTLRDLPAGWRLFSPASAVVLDKTACGLVASDSVALNSATFTSGGSGEQARSEIGVATTATIADDYALLKGSQGESCATKFIEQLNAGPVKVSGVSRLGPISTTDGVAIPMTGFQMVVAPTATATSAPVTVDVLAIFSGRFEVLSFFTGTTGAVAKATQTTVIQAINARISAANPR